MLRSVPVMKALLPCGLSFLASGAPYRIAARPLFLSQQTTRSSSPDVGAVSCVALLSSSSPSCNLHAVVRAAYGGMMRVTRRVSPSRCLSCSSPLIRSGTLFLAGGWL